MSTYAVDVRPEEARAVRYTVTLDGVAVVLRLRWLPRLVRWALVVETPDGIALTPQLVVYGGADVPLDTTYGTAPPGRLSWVGPETYRRTDLGRSLRLLYTEAA